MRGSSTVCKATSTFNHGQTSLLAGVTKATLPADVTKATLPLSSTSAFNRGQPSLPADVGGKEPK